MTSASTPRIDLSRMNIAGSEPPVRELTAGEVLTLTVVEKTAHGSGTNQSTRGVIIKGEFHEVEIPVEVKTGARVEIKVLATSPDTRLQFVKLAPEGQPEIPTPQALDLKTLLQALTQRLTQDARSTERTLATLLAAPKPQPSESEQPAEQPAEQNAQIAPRQITELLRKLAVITEREIRDPKTLTETLRTKPSQPALNELVQRTVEQRSVNANSPTPHQAELVRTVVAALERLADSQAPRGSSTNSTPHTKPTTKLPEQTALPERAPQTQTGMQTGKLIETLQSVRPTSKEALPTTGAEVRQLVQSQIMRLEQFTPQAKAALLVSQNESPLQSLVRIIARANLEQVDIQIPQQTLYKLIITELQEVLTDWLKLQKPSTEILPALERSLARLYSELGLAPDTERLDPAREEAPPPPGLTRQQYNTLRTIEAQLRVILESGEDSAPMSNDLRTAKLLNTLTVLREQLSAAVLEKLPLLSQLVRSGIQDKLAAITPQAQREIMRSVADELRAFIQQPVTNTPRPTDPPSRTMPTISQSPVVLRVVTEIERAIEALRITPNPQGTKDIALPQSAITTPGQAIQREIATLKLNLERIITQVSQPGDRSQYQLSTAAHEVLERITAQETAGTPITPSDLRRYASELRSRFLPGSTGAEHGSSTLDTPTLQALTSSLAARQGLEQLMPLAKSAGEPLMILFPMLLHGLASQVELRILGSLEGSRDRTGSVLDQGDRQSKDSSSSSTPFQRIQISVSFPKIGAVVFDLAHRSRELLLNMSFADKEIAEYVQSCVSKLEFAFAEMGFAHCTIRSAVLTQSLALTPTPLTNTGLIVA